MKKILPIICALAAVLTAACSKDDTGGKGGGGDKPSTVSVTGVSLNKSTMTLTVGKAESLVATVSPSNATNKNVTWSSDSESIARVSNGIVTAIAVGTVTIKVTTADGDKTATCKVTVTDKQVPAVNFDISPKTITVGGTTNLGVTVEPSTIKVRYKSSDPSVVTVDENGNVTAVGPGTATITIYTDETADCAPVSKTLGVTVTEKQVPKVNIDITPKTITVGGTTNLGVTVEPSTIT